MQSEGKATRNYTLGTTYYATAPVAAPEPPDQEAVVQVATMTPEVAITEEGAEEAGVGERQERGG